MSEVQVEEFGVSERGGVSLHRVLKERHRQISTLGYDAEHDAQHTPADWAYFIRRQLEGIGADATPTDGVYRAFDKAAALCLAALDALPGHTEYRNSLAAAELEAQVAIDREQMARREQQQRDRQAAAEAEDQQRRQQDSELERLQKRTESLEAELAELKQRPKSDNNGTSRRRTKTKRT